LTSVTSARPAIASTADSGRSARTAPSGDAYRTVPPAALTASETAWSREETMSTETVPAVLTPTPER
jgi:hypothetical protein